VMLVQLTLIMVSLTPSRQAIVASIDVASKPVRSAKFISRRHQFVAGSDDCRLRIFDFDSFELVFEWEAHSDYIRYIQVHPSLPYILR